MLVRCFLLCPTQIRKCESFLFLFKEFIMTTEALNNLVREYINETDHNKAAVLYERIINEYDRLGKVVPF